MNYIERTALGFDPRRKTHLEDSFADRRPCVGLIGSVPLGQLAAGLHGAVVESFKDLLVQKLGFFTEKKRKKLLIIFTQISLKFQLIETDPSKIPFS